MDKKSVLFKRRSSDPIWKIVHLLIFSVFLPIVLAGEEKEAEEEIEWLFFSRIENGKIYLAILEADVPIQPDHPLTVESFLIHLKMLYRVNVTSCLEEEIGKSFLSSKLTFESWGDCLNQFLRVCNKNCNEEAHLRPTVPLANQIKEGAISSFDLNALELVGAEDLSNRSILKNEVNPFSCLDLVIELLGMGNQGLTIAQKQKLLEDRFESKLNFSIGDDGSFFSIIGKKSLEIAGFVDFHIPRDRDRIMIIVPNPNKE